MPIKYCFIFSVTRNSFFEERATHRFPFILRDVALSGPAGAVRSIRRRTTARRAPRILQCNYRYNCYTRIVDYSVFIERVHARE
jgi:hypothetical protein